MLSDQVERQPGLMARLKKARRKRIKALGKRLIRSLSDFFGSQSLVGDKPVLDNAPFPFLDEFSARWREIRAEAELILEHREAVPAFQEVSPDQMRIATGGNWRTFILYGFGTKLEKNCRQAPFTTSLLEKVPNLQTAWFSILSPGYHIPAHRGVTKGILRAHLGLIIPDEAEKCWLRVDNEICVWRTGGIFVFDDTFEHEVLNDTPQERVILLFDFDRPMRWPGRAVSKTFIRLLKLTAFYREPRRNMRSFEDRFEAATRRADETLENLGED